MRKNHFWIGVVSRAHVVAGVAGGFAQLNHGKKTPLAKMKVGDWLIYYLPRISLESREPCRRFTAVGKVKTDDIYQFDMGNGFIPYHLDIDFKPCREVSILPLLDKLSFTKNKKSWGQQFRFGHFEVPEEDFMLIAKEMNITVK